MTVGNQPRGDYRVPLIRIGQAVWRSTLGEALTPVETGVDTNGDIGGVIGFIRFSGAWDGRLTLECDSDLAETLAARMFDSDQVLAASDVRDAIGELTNIVAGNLHALLDPPSQVSLPTVLVAQEGMAPADVEIVSRVDFECLGNPIRVTLTRLPSALTYAQSESSATG